MKRDVDIGFPILANLHLPWARIDKLKQISICVLANYERDRPASGAGTNRRWPGKVAGIHIADNGYQPWWPLNCRTGFHKQNPGMRAFTSDINPILCVRIDSPQSYVKVGGTIPKKVL